MCCTVKKQGFQVPNNAFPTPSTCIVHINAHTDLQKQSQLPYLDLADLLAGELIRSDALHEGDCMGVELVGLVGLVDYGKWDTEL